MRFSPCPGKGRFGSLTCALLLAALPLPGILTHAASLNWDADGVSGGATGGTGPWDTTSLLWDSAGVMRAWGNSLSDSAVFGGTAGTVTLGQPIYAGGLVFNTSGYVIDGAGSLTLGGVSPTITLSQSGTTQMSAAMILGGDTLIGGAGNLTLIGQLSVSPLRTGAVTLFKTGEGTLTLGGTNSAALVEMMVSGGVLSFANSTSLGLGKITLEGSVLQATGTSAMTNGITLGATGGTVEVTGAHVLTMSPGTIALGSAITGTGDFTKTGTGTLQVGVASSYVGSTTLSAGTLAGGIASFLPASSQLTVAEGATLNMNGFATSVASLEGAGSVVNTGASAVLTLSNFLGVVDSTFSGTLSGIVPVTKMGNGTLTLRNSGSVNTTSSATGVWTFGAGTVNLDFANSTTTNGILGSGVTLSFSGGALKVTGRTGETVVQAVTTTSPLVLNAGGSEIIMVPNGGTLTTLTFGSMPYSSSANSTTAGGSLLVTSPAGTAVRITTTGVVNGTYGGRIVFYDGNSYNWAANEGGSSPRKMSAYTGYTNLVASGSTETVNYLQTGTLAGGVTASQTVNTLKITTTAAGEKLDLNGNALTIATGGLLFTGAHNYEILSTGGVGSLKSNSASISDLIIHTYGEGELTISAPIVNGVGASTLTKGGTGTLVLTGANTYTGGTFIGAGTLSISSNSALGATATSAVMISDGATLRTTATMDTGTHLFTLFAGNANIDIANGTTLTVGGVMSGSGGLTLTNTGTLVLAAQATYSGPTFVGAGATLKGAGVAGASFLASSGGNLNIASGGVVDMNDGIMTVGGLAGSGSLTNSSATARIFVLGGNNQSSTFSGVISGAAGTPSSMAITKNGTGVLTLTNNNTFTGTTRINAGTVKLAVDNALGGGSTLIGAAAVPFASMDLDGHAQSFSAINFYGSNTASITQALINIGAGGVLTLGGNIVFSEAAATNGARPAWITGGTLSLTGTRTFTVVDSPNAAFDLTITSVISSTDLFGFIKSGAGTLQLTAANTYTGPTSVTNGSLVLSGAGTLGSTTSSLTMTAGTLDLNGSSQNVGLLTGAAAGSIRNNATGTLSILGIGNGSAAAGTYAGTVGDGAGKMGLTKEGTGTTTLSGTLTYTGPTVINQGGLTLGSTPNTLSGGIFINDGILTGGAHSNTFGLDTNLITLGAASGSADATVGITFNTGIIMQPILVRGGNTGTATILLGIGPSTTIWNGAVTLDNHSVTIGKTGTTASTGTLNGGITGTGNVIFNNTTTGGSITVANNTINPVGTLTNSGTSAGASVTITAVIGTNVTSVIQDSATTQLVLGLTDRGTGTAHTWSGTLVIKSGSVLGGANANTFGADTNQIILGDSTGSANTTLGITHNDSSTPIKQSITVRGGNTGIATFLLSVGSSTTIWDSSVTLENHDLTIGRTGGTSSTGTLRGGITGTGNLLLRNTTNQGNMVFSVGAINPVGTIVHTSTTIGTTTISAVIGSNITDVTHNSATSPFVLSGTEANAYSGTTYILNGSMSLSKTAGITAIPGPISLGDGTASAVVRLLNNDQIADTSIMTLAGTGANAGIFRMNNRNETLGGLASTGGAGIVENESGSVGVSTLTVNVAAGVQSFSGLLRDGNGADIDGTLALIKAGAGTQILTGLNTYTGTTLIQAGVLQVGSASVGRTGTGAVTVGNGGILSGTGRVQGASFTALSGAIIHAGDDLTQATLGTLTFQPESGSGGLDFQSGSTAILGIRADGTSDLLSFVGTGTNTLTFDGNLTVSGDGFTPSSEQVFNLLDWSGLSATPVFASRYSYSGILYGHGDEMAGLDLPNIFGSGYGWDISDFTVNGSIALITFIPEPSRALLLCGGLLVVVGRRRRIQTSSC